MLFRSDDTHAVIVPQAFNAIRTNKKEGIESYTGHDCRLDPDDLNGPKPIRKLFIERNQQTFLNWIDVISAKYPKESQIIYLLVTSLNSGYTLALNNDLILIDSYLNAKFNLSVDDTDSLPVFKDQLLLLVQARMITNLDVHLNQIRNGKFRSVTVNYAFRALLNE